MSHSDELKNAVRTWLKESSIPFEEKEGEFTILFHLKYDACECPLRISVTDTSISSIAMFKGFSLNNCLLEMAEFITHINSTGQFEKFVLDYDSGIVSCCSYLVCPNHVPRKEEFDMCILPPKDTLVKYSDEIISIGLDAAKHLHSWTSDIHYQNLLNAMRVVLDYLHIDYSFSDKRHEFEESCTFTIPYENEYIGKFNHDIIINHDGIISEIICPLNAKECLDTMSEFICRVNSSINLWGHFELDYDPDYATGEIRYQYFVGCKKWSPDTASLIDLVRLPTQMMRQFAEGITLVLSGEKSPEEAVEESWDYHT